MEFHHTIFSNFIHAQNFHNNFFFKKQLKKNELSKRFTKTVKMPLSSYIMEKEVSLGLQVFRQRIWSNSWFPSLFLIPKCCLSCQALKANFIIIAEHMSTSPDKDWNIALGYPDSVVCSKTKTFLNPEQTLNKQTLQYYLKAVAEWEINK